MIIKPSSSLRICISRKSDPTSQKRLLESMRLCIKRKPVEKFNGFGGERGIRTPGASQHGGFQDRCNRPLYHLSKAIRISPCFQGKEVLFSFSCAKVTPFLEITNF